MKRRSPVWHVVLLFACATPALAGVAAGAQDTPGAPRYTVAYATYLGGGAAEQLREVIPYPDGSVLVGGQTSSPDLRITPGAVQPRYAGEPAGTGHPGVYGGDCFLVRLSPDGRAILAATYFGGSRQERNVYGMALDREGNVVLSSATRSPDLPTTPGCWQPRYSGAESDGFVAKLTPDLTRLLWCTYLGGCWPRGGIGLDAEDNVFIVGGTDQAAFPTTPGVVRREVKGRNASIQKLRSDGSAVVWSTLLGGDVWDGTMGVRVDAAGDVYIAGHTQSPGFPTTPGCPQAALAGKSDCFVAKLTPDGGRLVYSTFLGGRENEFAEHRLCLRPDGSVLVTGVSASPDFPTTPGAFQRVLKGRNDGFLTAVSPDGRRLLFSTLLGGSGAEFYLMPTPDAAGNIFIVGNSTSPDFPVTPGAVQTAFGGPAGQGGDGVLAVFSPDGSRLLYATYLGGSGADLIRSVALGPAGEVYLVGSTSSPDFPVTPGAAQGALSGPSDAFVVKLVPAR